MFYRVGYFRRNRSVLQLDANLLGAYQNRGPTIDLFFKMVYWLEFSSNADISTEISSHFTIATISDLILDV
jgi:hypothetical protein